MSHHDTFFMDEDYEDARNVSILYFYVLIVVVFFGANSYHIDDPCFANILYAGCNRNRARRFREQKFIHFTNVVFVFLYFLSMHTSYQSILFLQYYVRVA